jgi:molybdopterin-guanine dinucleotide biosynthesis protein A
MKTAPECAWLVLACDLPLVSAEVLRKLLATRDSQKMATAYISKTNGLPEPMCAIYEPKFFHPMMRWIEAGKTCPRKMLIDSDVRLVELCNLNALDNANTQDDRIRLQGVLSGLECKDLRIRYFAAMKDATGRPAESIRSYARTAEELYQELNARYQFSLRHDLIKVAVNGALKSHDVVLNPGDEIVFIPPVAGG